VNHPEPQARLPAFDAEDALRFVAALQSVIDAVWRAHGEAMGERLLDRHIAKHGDAADAGPSLDDFDELPF
jgi:hypothetical protein